MERGQRGSPTGDRHAAALQYFYDNLTATHALEQDATGGVDELVYQVASAIDNRYSIHEMLLRVDNAAAREVTAEFRHTPIWFFECRRGYLGYLQHIFDVYGKPCIGGEWLTAVNIGWMRPLCMAYAMKMFPLRDWLTFCERYGSGFLDATTDAAINSPEWNQAQKALNELANDGAVLHNANVHFKFLEQSARNSLPFHPIVELVNGLYAKCYRGVDLATGSRGAAAGEKGTVAKGNPVGATIQKEESGIFLVRDAKWVTGVFNERIDRPILRYLFNQEPRAWFALMPPLADTTDKDLASLQTLVPMGLKIALKEVYKRFRWSVPEASEPVLAPAANAAPAAGHASPPGATTEPVPAHGHEKKIIHHSHTARASLDAPIAPGAAINEAAAAAAGAEQIASPAMPDAGKEIDMATLGFALPDSFYAERLARLESRGLGDSQAARAVRKRLNR